MTKSGEPPDRYCGAPEPPSDTAAEGMAWAKQLAQRYLPNDVRLCAIIAFGENNASMDAVTGGTINSADRRGNPGNDTGCGAARQGRRRSCIAPSAKPR